MPAIGNTNLGGTYNILGRGGKSTHNTVNRVMNSVIVI